MTGSTITELALADTICVQLATWTGRELGVRIPERITSLADLSELMHRVRARHETEWGDYDDDDSIRAVAHVINADIGCARAAHGHGAANLLSALTSLIVAASILA